MTEDLALWNHNIEYYPVVLRSIPQGALRGLDVGCGEGLLAHQLRQRVRHVVGIDPDQASISKARSTSQGVDIDFVVGDFMTYPFEPASFDLVASVASLHHMDVRSSIDRMKALLRPGGRLVVIGCARSTPFDLPLDLVGLVTNCMHKRAKAEWNDHAPRLRPAATFGHRRRLTAADLPGRVYRRRLLWRYSIVWTSPNPSSEGPLHG